jgi:hypothetical protein
MAQKTIYVDDLTGDEVDENTIKHGKLTLDDETEQLDLTPVTYDALRALLHRDPEPLRAVFAPATVVRRTKTEIEHIRNVAREFGGFDVKDTGRLPRTVVEWFENEYTPAQEGTGDADSNADSEPATPTATDVPKQRGRK